MNGLDTKIETIEFLKVPWATNLFKTLHVSTKIVLVSIKQFI